LGSVLVLVKIEGNSKNQSPEIIKIKATSNINEQIEWYKQLIGRVGAEEAQEELKRSGLPFTGQTHLLNHEAGEYLYSHEGPAGLVKCRDYLLESCYHGFVIAAISDKGMSVLGDIMKTCKSEGPAVNMQCAHAIGHALLPWVGYADLPRALELCQETAKQVKDFPSYNCEDGVFMENVYGVHSGEPSPDRWVKLSDPHYPCDSPKISEKYRRACWGEQSSIMYQYFNGDIKKMGNECLKAPNPSYRDSCFEGLALIIHPITEGKADKAFTLCGQLPEGWVSKCLATVAAAGYSTGDRNSPYEICRNVEEAGKKDCYSEFSGAIALYSNTPEERNRACRRIKEDAWRQQCLDDNSFFSYTHSPQIPN